MASGALTPAVVDVPIGSLNSLPPDHAGPTGRMTAIYDALIRHYQGGDSKRVFLEPREGFRSFSSVLQNSTTGLEEAGTWADPEFLAALGDQLLSICSNRPRVYNGTDWTNYGDRRVVTQKLSESVLHATNGTIAAPDSAWLAGVTCAVWTEQAYVDGYGGGTVIRTTAWVGFRADDGAWLRVPTVLYTAEGGSGFYMLAKVVAAGEHFWVFHNAESSGRKIFVNAYDLSGAQLAATNVHRVSPLSPGYWDVYGSVLGGILLAQQNSIAVDPGDDLGVEITRFTYNGPSDISTEVSHLTAAHCQGEVAWLTNDLTGAAQYLATLGPNTAGDPPQGKFWVYEIADDLTVSKEYDVGTVPGSLPDSITGWAVESGVTDHRDVYVSWSELAQQYDDGGPPFDPALRFTKTVKRTYAGATTTIRQTNSVIQQSRAFAIDNEYHSYTYYASGSGQTLPSSASNIALADGDYFIGAPQAPIVVTTNDVVYGAPIGPVSLSPNGLLPQLAMTPKNIDDSGTPDSVVATTASGLFGVVDGSPVLRWTFKNATFDVTPSGAILKIVGSSISSANFSWDILAGSSSTVLYTSTVSRLGGTLTPGSFVGSGGGGGTVEVVGTLLYPISNLPDFISPEAAELFDNGEIIVSGASNSGNNGTFTILINRTIVSSPTSGSFGYGPGVWVLLTTQVFEDPTSASVIVQATNVNAWSFGNELFTAADIDSTLVVSDNPVLTNDGPFVITDAPDFDHLAITGGPDAAAVVPQIFVPPLPTVVIQLPGSATPYTLHIASVTFDYTYINALVNIANANHSTTNGTYKIVEFVDDHTVVVIPTNGETNQRSESFNNDESPNEVVIFIQLGTNVNQPTQPTWFVTPLTGTMPQVGMFEKGLAFADWRFDGESGALNQNIYRFALSSTSNLFDTTRQVVLPFRASTFTQVSVATVGATEINIANAALASTVGLKVFQSTGKGEGIGESGSLLVPGLLATEFTTSGFAESNFNAGPEAPFLVSQADDTSTTFALTLGATYTIQVVIATTLENGQVVRSLPSPPVQYTLTGSNNSAVYGGRLIKPLGTDGLPSTTSQGLTNNRQATYEIYRTVVVAGVPSTQLHLITNPANPNGLYSGSGPGSGFTFPDEFTWNYRDENPDAGVQATEVVYAGALGQGIAPHFPAPAFKHATTWANRRWVVGYDGAIWMSSEIVEGEPPWFFPGFRYPFPAEDPAVCVVGFENFLFMLCAKSIWRIPFAQLPNATLTAGSMPTPVRLPFAMGCSGFAVAMPDMVAYSSSVNDGRQVWAITRDLANIYLSEAIADDIGQPVSGMAVDGSQRLLVLADSTKIHVFDPVPKEWYSWRMPATGSPPPVTVTPGSDSYDGSGAWTFQHGAFDSSYVGGTLVIAGGAYAGTYTITTVTSSTQVVMAPEPADPGLPTLGLVQDINSLTGVTVASTLVSAWEDQSAAGQDFIQATSGQRPYLLGPTVDGYPVITFGVAGDANKFMATAGNFKDRGGVDMDGSHARTVLAVTVPAFDVAWGRTGGIFWQMLDWIAQFELRSDFVSNGAYGWMRTVGDYSNALQFTPITGGAGGPYDGVPTLVGHFSPGFPTLTFTVNGTPTTLTPSVMYGSPGGGAAAQLSNLSIAYLGGVVAIGVWDYNLTTNPTALAQALLHFGLTFPSAAIAFPAVAADSITVTLAATASSPILITSYLGKPTYQDSGFVSKQSDSGFVDTRAGVDYTIAIDATFNSLSFAAVRAVKRLWEAQIMGRLVGGGPVNINASISYPDDSTSTPTVFGPTAVTLDPLLLAINPAIEDATSFVIRVFGSYEGVETPGRCFALEMLSCEVGLDASQGLRKLPNGFRLVGA